MAMTDVREVWSWNLEREISSLLYLLTGLKFVSFDTEFPGCLRNTWRYASAETRYCDMRYNANRTKLIKLGITISEDSGNVGEVWEFNFRDFDERSDDHAPASIAMVKKNGLNFDRLRKEGIAMKDFGERLMEIIRPHQDLSWLTFQGLYDAGYPMKVLTKTDIPESIEEFVAVAREVFGSICDVKYMARFCEGLEKGEIGLEKMSKLLKLIESELPIAPERLEGFLYGQRMQTLPLQAFAVEYEDNYAPYTCT